MSKTVYGGRWEIQESVDEGGQAQVFLVKDLSGNESHPCALKRILNGQRRARFLSEVQACKQLNHPGIIRLIDHSALDHVEPVKEKMYLVMPFLKGGNLADRAGMYKGSLDTSLKVALDLAKALDHAHLHGVIHRDVKPANVLFERVDHDCVLSDFGICLIRDQLPRPTDTGEVVGPRAFMAPELEDGGQLDVTPAADIYSLGKVIYFMMSGGRVLPRERQREVQFDIFSGMGMRHEMLAQLLDQMICQVDQRLRSASEVISRLDRIQKWEQESGDILPTGAAAILEEFVKRQRDAASIDDHNRLVMEKHQALLDGYKRSVSIWLDERVASLASALSHEGAIQTRVLDGNECTALLEAATPIQLGRGTSGLRPLLVRGLSLTNPRDPFKHAHYLALKLFTEVHIRVQVGYTPRKVTDEEETVWLVPYYLEDQNMQGFFTRKDRATPRVGLGSAMRVQQPDVPQINRSFIGEGYTLTLKSAVSAWPSALADYRAVIDQAVEIFVDFVQRKFTTGGSMIGQ